MGGPPLPSPLSRVRQNSHIPATAGGRPPSCFRSYFVATAGSPHSFCFPTRAPFPSSCTRLLAPVSSLVAIDPSPVVVVPEPVARPPCPGTFCSRPQLLLMTGHELQPSTAVSYLSCCRFEIVLAPVARPLFPGISCSLLPPPSIIDRVLPP